MSKTLKIITIISTLILIIALSIGIYKATQRHLEAKRIDKYLEELRNDMKKWDKVIEEAQEKGQIADEVIRKMRERLNQ